MPATVEFLFDLASPAAYLAWTRMPGLAARTGARVVFRPILLGGLFKALGNRSPVEIPAKGRWFRADLERFADRYGVPLAWPPGFPVNSLELMRGAVAAERAGVLAAYGDAVYGGMFGRGLDMADPGVVAGVLREAGLDADALMAEARTAPVKEALRAATAEAEARGAFGVPTFFVGGAMFFGQDRLDWVEAALRRPD
ncbi:MAG TPA: 2-hydroxychromene-2-carboxylate isomerase [Azospirillaceae bacterium]|nr:2-hydroxychromene-2-carboxylate isomerase [Azospirillaceae bacterium]